MTLYTVCASLESTEPVARIVDTGEPWPCRMSAWALASLAQALRMQGLHPRHFRLEDLEKGGAAIRQPFARCDWLSCQIPVDDALAEGQVHPTVQTQVARVGVE